jgi:hypothetical protein
MFDGVTETNPAMRQNARNIQTSYFAPAIEVSRISSSESATPYPEKVKVSSQTSFTPKDKAEISAGSISGFILLVGILLWYWRRRATRKSTSETVDSWGKAELDTTALDRSKGQPELMVHEVHEMEGSAHQPVEMGIAPGEIEAERGVEVDAPRGIEMDAPRGVEIGDMSRT